MAEVLMYPPAYAGMTIFYCTLDSRLHGNDELLKPDPKGDKSL